MAGNRTGYTREFKIAVLAQIESGTPMAQVARENGIYRGFVAR